MENNQKILFAIAGIVIILTAVLPFLLNIGKSSINKNETKAESQVIDEDFSSIKAQITEKVNEQYPNLPEEYKNEIIESEFKKAVEENKNNNKA